MEMASGLRFANLLLPEVAAFVPRRNLSGDAAASSTLVGLRKSITTVSLVDGEKKNDALA